MSIFIFSKPIHSGKTSLLMDWCNRKKSCAGILMPDVNGSRKMYAIHDAEFFDVQCKQPATENKSIVSIGQYFFYADAFKKANAVIIKALDQPAEWLIIDEVGKLEVDGKGFYPAVQKAVEAFTQKTFTGNVLLVVRDTLVNEVLKEFAIEKYEVISALPQ